MITDYICAFVGVLLKFILILVAKLRSKPYGLLDSHTEVCVLQETSAFIISTWRYGTVHLYLRTYLPTYIAN